MTESWAELIAELELRVARLEALLGNKGAAASESSNLLAEPVNLDAVVSWLKSEGLIREPSSEEIQLAAEWDALSEEEKKRVLWDLDHLPPGSMVSDIVLDNRR